MTDSQILRKNRIFVSNIELLFVPNDAHTRYLLASDWFINLGIERCSGVGKYKSNSAVKYHFYPNVDATDRVTFKENFVVNKWAHVTPYTCMRRAVKLLSYIIRGKYQLKRIP